MTLWPSQKSKQAARERFLIAAGTALSALALVAVMAGVLWFYLQSELYGQLAGPPEAQGSQPDYAHLKAHIGGYTLPEGFWEFGYEDLGFSVMVLGDPQGEMVIVLVAYPQDAADYPVTAEQVARAHAEGVLGMWDVRWGLVEERAERVAGAEVLMRIMEGVDEQGQAYHSCRCVYAGVNGPVWVMVAAPVDQWDEQVAAAFFSSVGK